MDAGREKKQDMKMEGMTEVKRHGKVDGTSKDSF